MMPFTVDQILAALNENSLLTLEQAYSEDPNIINIKHQGNSLLKLAIIQNKPPIFNWLIDKQPILESDVLHTAVQNKQMDMVKNLLDKNPLLVNQKNGEGKSPLHVAVLRNSIEPTSQLLAYNAAPTQTDDNGRSVIDIANNRREPLRTQLLILLLNATKLVELKSDDSTEIIFNKIVTSLLYEYKRSKWNEEPCKSLRKYSGFFHADMNDQINPAQLEKHLWEQEKNHNTFYGSYLSEDSDSDEESQYSFEEKKENEAKKNIGYADQSKFYKRLINPLTEIKNIPNELKIELRVRAQIHTDDYDEKTRLNEIINDLNQLTKSGASLKEAAKKINHIYRKNLFIAQYRGITYLTTNFSQKSRKMHREKNEIGQPQYSSAVLLGGTNTHTIAEYNKKLRDTPEQTYENLNFWAISLKKHMLEMKLSGKIIYNKYTYQHAAHLLQDLYSKNYHRFFTFINNNNLFRNYLFNGYLPFISTSDVPYHALKYAYGIKPYEGKEHERLRPRWQKNGKNERPYSGKLYLSLHPLKDFDDEGIHHIITLNAQANVQIDNQIIAERESTFFSFLPKDKIIIQHLAKYPSFNSYKNIYLKKYGLDKKFFELFRNKLNQTLPHTTERSSFKKILGEWLCAYYEVTLIEKARLEAQARNGYLVYRDENGLFHASNPPLDSPFRKPGKDIEKKQKIDLGNARRTLRRTMVYNLSHLSNFKPNYSFGARPDILATLQSNLKYNIESLVIDDDTVFSPCIGIDLNYKSDGLLLHYFTHQNKQHAVKALVEAGAPLNYRDNNGNTALHIALLNNHQALVVYLLETGSSLDIPNNDQITAQQLLDYYPVLWPAAEQRWFQTLSLAKSIAAYDAGKIKQCIKESSSIVRLSHYERYLRQTIIDIFIHKLTTPTPGYQGYQERCAIAQALASTLTQDQTFLAKLLTFINSENPLVREAIVISLGHSTLIENEIIATLNKCLEDNDYYVRAHAADALSHLGMINRPMVETLLKVSRVSHYQNRYSYVVDHLDKVWDEDYPEFPEQSLYSLAKRLKKQYVILLEKLFKPNQEINLKALAFIKKLTHIDESIINILIKELSNENTYYKDTEVVPSLVDIQKFIIAELKKIEGGKNQNHIIHTLEIAELTLNKLESALKTNDFNQQKSEKKAGTVDNDDRKEDLKNEELNKKIDSIYNLRFVDQSNKHAYQQAHKKLTLIFNETDNNLIKIHAAYSLSYLQNIPEEMLGFLQDLMITPRHYMSENNQNEFIASLVLIQNNHLNSHLISYLINSIQHKYDFNNDELSAAKEALNKIDPLLSYLYKDTKELIRRMNSQFSKEFYINDDEVIDIILENYSNWRSMTDIIADGLISKDRFIRNLAQRIMCKIKPEHLSEKIISCIICIIKKNKLTKEISLYLSTIGVYLLEITGDINSTISLSSFAILGHSLENLTARMNYFNLSCDQFLDAVTNVDKDEQAFEEARIYLENLNITSFTTSLPEINSEAEQKQLDIVALYSRRIITQIQLNNNETKSCRVVAAEPDGNCAFTAIRRIFLLKGRGDLAKLMYRDKFTELVKTLHESDSPATANIVQDIFTLDNVNNFNDWQESFIKSSNHAADVHLRLLSKHYNLIFHIYCIPPEENILHFVPELGNDVIDETNADIEQITIELAHIPITFDVQVINHFDGIITSPTLSQRQKIDGLLQGLHEADIFITLTPEPIPDGLGTLIANSPEFTTLMQSPDKQENPLTNKPNRHQRRNSAPPQTISLFSNNNCALQSSITDTNKDGSNVMNYPSL